MEKVTFFIQNRAQNRLFGLPKSLQKLGPFLMLVFVAFWAPKSSFQDPAGFAQVPEAAPDRHFRDQNLKHTKKGTLVKMCTAPQRGNISPAKNRVKKMVFLGTAKNTTFRKSARRLSETHIQPRQGRPNSQKERDANLVLCMQCLCTPKTAFCDIFEMTFSK